VDAERVMSWLEDETARELEREGNAKEVSEPLLLKLRTEVEAGEPLLLRLKTDERETALLVGLLEELMTNVDSYDEVLLGWLLALAVSVVSEVEAELAIDAEDTAGKLAEDRVD
jgi:hypothetical protein